VSPEPNIRRASSEYSIEIEDKKILIDFGVVVFGRLLEYSLHSKDVTNIIFSHLHSDHMIDYPCFIYAVWDKNYQMSYINYFAFYF
jgi:ribonuclease Z